MNHAEGSELEPSEVLFSQRSSSPILLSNVPSSIRLRQSNSNARLPPSSAELAELFNLTNPDNLSEELQRTGRRNYHAQRPSPAAAQLSPLYQFPLVLPAGSNSHPVAVTNVPGDQIALVFSSSAVPPPQVRTQRPICTHRTSLAGVPQSRVRGEPWSNRLQRISNLHHNHQTRSAAGLPSRDSAGSHSSSNFVGPYLPRYPPRQASSRLNNTASNNTRLVYPAYFIQQHPNNPFVRRNQHWPTVVMSREYQRYAGDDLMLDDVYPQPPSRHQQHATSPPWVYHPAYTPVLTAAAAFAFGTAAAIVGTPQPPPGLPESVIASIPRRRGSVTRDGQSDGNECPICLDVCKDEWCKRLPMCGHEFHAGCLDRWLLQKNNCPVCRRIAVVYN